ncbi:MAG: UDP-N-acetylmuramoyl-L-alanine--D-glutamate ligase [Marinilabiliaceae bacterium]|nr:UDP-N-acetylmuramoyl-L-alanine--D-glutamate ligase [Marinilabiliaceae bacterium]
MNEIIILGAGESGVGAALLAKAKNIRVFISDSGTISSEVKKVLEMNNIPLEEGKHSEERILNAAEIIKSPGISENVPIIKKIRQKGIPIISEIEFAGRYSNALKIGITGSNGKTTTATWIYHILKKAGKDVVLTGNIGTSFARVVSERDPKIAVIELSSFQLDDMYDFICDIAVLTNITSDHLDRYENDFQKYTNSKFKITQNQRDKDSFIFNLDDQTIKNNLTKLMIKRGYPVSFSVKNSAWIDENKIVFWFKNKRFEIDFDSLSLKGKHNNYNAMCAGLAALLADVPGEDVIKGLSDFQGVENRLEFVDKINGVTFINDSKATNIDSVWYALDSIIEPIIWIAGGTDKGNDYSSLFDLAKNKVKALICLGIDNSKLLNSFTGIVPIIKETKSMEETIDIAFKIAEIGETVLLSPACASFDLFKNYEHRGDLFKYFIKKMRFQI